MALKIGSFKVKLNGKNLNRQLNNGLYKAFSKLLNEKGKEFKFDGIHKEYFEIKKNGNSFILKGTKKYNKKHNKDLEIKDIVSLEVKYNEELCIKTKNNEQFVVSCFCMYDELGKRSDFVICENETQKDKQTNSKADEEVQTEI